MLIAQFTDFHVSTPGSKMDRLYDTGGHLARAVEHINALATPPDLVLGTGDLVDGGTEDEYRRLRGILAPLTAPLYLIPGNHDDRAAMARVFDDHAYLPRDGSFMQYTVEGGPVRLIALDTLVPGQSGGLLCEERLGWLEARLAEQPGRPTLIFMHHPPFLTGLKKMDAMGLQNIEGLQAVIDRHPQVERIAAGHLHRPITRRFSHTVAVTCPATAHQIALDLRTSEKLATVMEPPAVMLHAWLPDGAGLVSHMSYVGRQYAETPIFDGQRWLSPDPA